MLLPLSILFLCQTLVLTTHAISATIHPLPSYFNIGLMFSIEVNDRPSPDLNYFGAM